MSYVLFDESEGRSITGAKLGGDTFITALYSGGQATAHSPHLTHKF